MKHRCRFNDCHEISWYGKCGSGRKAEFCAHHGRAGIRGGESREKVVRAHHGCITGESYMAKTMAARRVNSAPNTPRLGW